MQPKGNFSVATSPEKVASYEANSNGVDAVWCPSGLCRNRWIIRKLAFVVQVSMAFAAALPLAGCLTDVEPHVTPVNETALGLSAAQPHIQANWWVAYRDPQLDRLIALGLSANPSLDTALARVETARSQVLSSQSKLFPQISGNTQINRARIGDKLLPEPLGGHASTLVQAGAALGWDLDLFGRQHALVRSADARALSAAYDTDAARLTVSVAIAETYVGLARAAKQIQVANGLVVTRQESLELARRRGRADLTGDAEVQTNETLLAQAQQASTRATRDRDVLIHALAALVGRGADFYSEIREPRLSLGRVPNVPRVLPADLVGRRPDLMAARARINAAIGGREAAAAAFLPDINVTALVGLAAFGASNFFAPGAGYYLAGPALSLPIFDAGRLHAQYKEATADLDAAVADYNSSVINAIRDAADAVTNLRAADADLAEQTRVVMGLRNIDRLSQVRVSTGLGSNLDALDAGFRLLEAEQGLIQLQANALSSRIRLVAVLGGGFDRHSAAAALASRD